MKYEYVGTSDLVQVETIVIHYFGMSLLCEIKLNEFRNSFFSNSFNSSKSYIKSIVLPNKPCLYQKIVIMKQ